MNRISPIRTAALVLSAGLAGGAAEILWVLAYGTLAGIDAAEVAREVTASLSPGAARMPGAPALGVAIHLALSVALGFAFFLGLRRRLTGGAQTLVLALGVLLAVWALNFLVLLPVLNPRLVTLMPAAATLFSKALFGAVMGGTLAVARVPAG